MSDFILHTTQPAAETPVSNIFLDEYMPAANGAYVKIYLYLLRCIRSGQDMLSIPSIADRFEHTENDVRRALSYWEKLGLLRLEYNSEQVLIGICLLEPRSRKDNTADPRLAPSEQTTAASRKAVPSQELSGQSLGIPENQTPTQTLPRQTAGSPENTDHTQEIPRQETSSRGNPPSPLEQTSSMAKTDSKSQAPAKSDYTADQLAQFQEQRDIRQLLFISEQYLGKTLSPSEVSTILYFYDGLGFSPDLIEYLIEYCVSKNHKSLRYMETVALSWHKKGFTTVTQAKKEGSRHSKAYFSVLKAFGIQGRNPVESEMGSIDTWMQEWGFSLELVLEACGRTMNAIHQPSFEYAESILKNWLDKQVKSLEDVKVLDAQRTKKAPKSSSPGGNGPKKAGAPNRFHNFKQRDYDFSELEKKLINH
ncbi:MAG: DnaD domain protein [Lachnospiraceae bacterium]|nr:DnaD domain protein [Lachnospiraceae bacterium]